MNLQETVLLGAIAGLTIYLGLPLGRIERVSDRIRSFLTGTSVGILLFLFFDIFENIQAPINEAVLNAAGGRGSTAEAAGLVAVFVLGLGAGLIGLVFFESRFLHAGQPAGQAISPGRLSMMIAAGLGLHNFSEGLAIGQSAGTGRLALAALLIVGFGLHNATEGFGIVGPLAGTRPSWTFLGIAGLVGGGPTFVGTIVGYTFVSTSLSVLFLSVAAGAIIYVVGELYYVARYAGLKQTAMWGLVVGFLVAFGTDLVLALAGA
ncbi:MAG: zinc permease [Chloroflexi bacterium]|nr:zinc permease [Chloroflexota bacterium]